MCCVYEEVVRAHIHVVEDSWDMLVGGRTSTVIELMYTHLVIV